MINIQTNSDNSKQSTGYNELINNELNYYYPLGFLTLHDLQGMSLNGREELQYFIDNFPEIAEREKENLLLHLRSMRQGKYYMNIIGFDTVSINGCLTKGQLWRRAKELGLIIEVTGSHNLILHELSDDQQFIRKIQFNFNGKGKYNYCKITIHAGKFLSGYDLHLANGYELHKAIQFVAKLLKIDLSQWTFGRLDISLNFLNKAIQAYKPKQMSNAVHTIKRWAAKVKDEDNGFYLYQNKDFKKSQKIICVYKKTPDITRIENRFLNKSRNKTSFASMFKANDLRFTPNANATAFSYFYDRLVSYFIKNTLEMLRVEELKDKRKSKSTEFRKMVYSELYKSANQTKVIQSMDWSYIKGMYNLRKTKPIRATITRYISVYQLLNTIKKNKSKKVKR